MIACISYRHSIKYMVGWIYMKGRRFTIKTPNLNHKITSFSFVFITFDHCLAPIKLPRKGFSVSWSRLLSKIAEKFLNLKAKITSIKQDINLKKKCCDILKMHLAMAKWMMSSGNLSWNCQIAFINYLSIIYPQRERIFLQKERFWWNL